MAKVNLQALTQELISFEFNTSEIKLNSVSPLIPYYNFQINSDFVTDGISVSITIPEPRQVPKSIVVKLINIRDSLECREFAINCNGQRVSKVKLEGKGFIFAHASSGRPRSVSYCRQKAEITLIFGSYSEILICPINKTTEFNICFGEARRSQEGPFPGAS